MQTQNSSNGFMVTLQRHRGGKLLDEASKALQELVAAVALTGKGGTVTLTLAVKPATRGQAAVVVQDRMKTKIPQMEPEASFWFATADGDLQKDDPRQASLPLGVVPGGNQTIDVPARAVGQ